MSSQAEAPRLFLITPASVELPAFAVVLAEVLAAGDVAAVLIAGSRNASFDAAAAALVPIIQNGGAAAIVADDTRLAGRYNADGVHVTTGLADLADAARSLRPKRIVGAGNIATRHEAMEAGEAGPDYLFFGREHDDTHDAPHPKTLDLAEWWSDVATIPAVVMAGRHIDSVSDAVATGAAFVGLAQRDLVASRWAGGGRARGAAAAQRCREADRVKRIVLAIAGLFCAVASAVAQQPPAVEAAPDVEQRIEQSIPPVAPIAVRRKRWGRPAGRR